MPCLKAIDCSNFEVIVAISSYKAQILIKVYYSNHMSPNAFKVTHMRLNKKSFNIVLLCYNFSLNTFGNNGFIAVIYWFRANN